MTDDTAANRARQQGDPGAPREWAHEGSRIEMNQDAGFGHQNVFERNSPGIDSNKYLVRALKCMNANGFTLHQISTSLGMPYEEVGEIISTPNN